MGSREKCRSFAPLSNTDVLIEGARCTAREPKLMIKSALINYAIGNARKGRAGGETRNGGAGIQREERGEGRG
jgi:hypothetical protein